jgi:hypothetical protein
MRPNHIRALLQFLVIGVVLEQDTVDSSLSQEISLHLLRVVAGGAGGRLVHPIDSIKLLRLAGSFLEALELLYLSFFFTLAFHLVDAFALVQRALFLLPYALLVLD